MSQIVIHPIVKRATAGKQTANWFEALGDVMQRWNRALVTSLHPKHHLITLEMLIFSTDTATWVRHCNFDLALQLFPRPSPRGEVDTRNTS